ncbi:MAG: hypothetical protein RL318_1382 [Fibrobacterota bacterium]
MSSFIKRPGFFAASLLVISLLAPAPTHAALDSTAPDAILLHPLSLGYGATQKALWLGLTWEHHLKKDIDLVVDPSISRWTIHEAEDKYYIMGYKDDTIDMSFASEALHLGVRFWWGQLYLQPTLRVAHLSRESRRQAGMSYDGFQVAPMVQWGLGMEEGRFVTRFDVGMGPGFGESRWWPSPAEQRDNYVLDVNLTLGWRF